MGDYIKVKARWKLLLCILFFSNGLLLFADEPPLLTPKRRAKPVVVEETRTSRSRLEFLVLTPLGKEDFYESRFSTFGGGALFSFPFFHFDSGIDLYGSLGLLATLSKLSLNQGTTQFTSLYLQFPLLVRGVYPLNEKMQVGGFAGVALRTTRYDSRNTTDGGWQKVSGGDFFQPEVGAEFNYRVSSSLWVKLKASYLFLALGLELAL